MLRILLSKLVETVSYVHFSLLIGPYAPDGLVDAVVAVTLSGSDFGLGACRGDARRLVSLLQLEVEGCEVFAALLWHEQPVAPEAGTDPALEQWRVAIQLKRLLLGKE